MKKYWKELIILTLQLLMFYVSPLAAGPADAIGMVLLIVIATFILAMAMGIMSKEKIKYLYPIFTSVLFIPSVFIYYNESALVHSVWYLVISSIGLSMGALICHFRN